MVFLVLSFGNGSADGSLRDLVRFLCKGDSLPCVGRQEPRWPEDPNEQGCEEEPAGPDRRPTCIAILGHI